MSYITGVQLEVGSTATPFEHRSFGEELALCQGILKNLITRRCYQTHQIVMVLMHFRLMMVYTKRWCQTDTPL